MNPSQLPPHGLSFSLHTAIIYTTATHLLLGSLLILLLLQRGLGRGCKETYNWINSAFWQARSLFRTEAEGTHSESMTDCCEK